MSRSVNDVPLSKAEIAAWVEALARSDSARISAIRQLLKNKRGDSMSPSDEAICNMELRKLVEKNGQAPAHKTVGTGQVKRQEPRTSDRRVITKESPRVKGTASAQIFKDR